MVLSPLGMDGNIGSQHDGSRPGPTRMALYPRRTNKVNMPSTSPGMDDVPIQAMTQLTIEGCRRCSCQLAAVPLPTWGQVKKLSDEGQKLLARKGKLHNAENLFLAMCTLLSLTSASAEASVSYWTYIPNPPLFEPVFGEMLMLLCLPTLLCCHLRGEI